MKPSSIRAQESHQRRMEKGWRKLQLFISPDAAKALAALEAATGQKPTTIINALLNDSMAQKPSSSPRPLPPRRLS